MRWLISLAAIGMVGCSSNNNPPVGGNGNPDMSVMMMKPDLMPPGPPPSQCDVIKQDCTMGQKCIPNATGGMATPSNVCVPDGTIAAGATCQQSTVNPLVLNDNCVKGTYCDNDGPGNKFYCAKYCSVDADCTGTKEKCINLFPAVKWGVCLKTCTPFGTDCTNPGDSCAVGLGDNNGGMNATGDTWYTCKMAGTGAIWSGPTNGQCGADTDCGPGLVCDSKFMWCAPICDATHACMGMPPMGTNDMGVIGCQVNNMTTMTGTCSTM